MITFNKTAVAGIGIFFALQMSGCASTTASTSHRKRTVSARSAAVDTTVYPPSGEGNLLLGNPSGAGTDPNNYLLTRPQYTLSYNRSNGEANWVSWHVDKSDLGPAKRGTFHPDPLLPPDWQIRPTDYRGSGYDRGHICPSGDRTSTRENNDATFNMSNMLPQAKALNEKVWKKLEDYERSLLKKNEIYVIAGGSGTAGRIGQDKVNVPAVCWKIIVVLPRGTGDLARITANTRVIAVSMPNRERDEIGDSRWADWITTVDQIEKTTGYDFLSAVPTEIQDALESQKDSGRADSDR